MNEDVYDEWVDRIICSDDFIHCKHCKDGECLKKEGRKCWNISKCPLGKERR